VTKNSLLPILLSGILDIIGNAAYAFASQLGRMDIAAVLGSLCPGATVQLAWVLLKERINRQQKLGIVIGLIGIMMISMKI
jgi:uncharacterized membrane protein